MDGHCVSSKSESLVDSWIPATFLQAQRHQSKRDVIFRREARHKDAKVPQAESAIWPWAHSFFQASLSKLYSRANDSAKVVGRNQGKDPCDNAKSWHVANRTCGPV